MKKLKYLALFLLILPFVISTRANNIAIGKKVMKAEAQHAHAPVRLIDQILFPHGM